jgi:hypothetical protein
MSRATRKSDRYAQAQKAERERRRAERKQAKREKGAGVVAVPEPGTEAR